MRFRTWIIGLSLVLCIAIAAPYVNLVMKGSQLAHHYAPLGAMLAFLLLTGVLNPVLARWLPPAALRTDELVIIYVMLLVGSAIPTWGMVCQLLPIMTGVQYYATVQNRWAQLITPQIPSWLVPADPYALRCFYEGAPSGSGIPWNVWLGPLAAWSVFILALYAAMYCMMVILRKQWVERERLVFPLVYLPLQMAECEPGRAVGPFFRNRVMWIGFGISFGIVGYNGLGEYFHFCAPVPLRTGIRLLGGAAWHPILLSLPTLGFAFLLQLDVALSLWLFSILGSYQTGALRILGFSLGPREAYCASGPAASYQGFGALIVLVAFGLWTARRHLAAVFRKAVRDGRTLEDEGELLSYRTAFFGAVLSILLMGIWLRLTGLGPVWAPVFLVVAFVALLGLTRAVCNGGINIAKSPLIPQSFMVHGLGGSALGSADLVALAYTFPWVSDTKNFMWPALAHGFKLLDGVRARRRTLTAALALTMLLSFVVSVWWTLALSYRHGGINLSRWLFGGCPQVPFRYVAPLIERSPGISMGRWLFLAIGISVMAFLMLLRYRFFWWPIHPLGFPIGNTLPVIYISFSIFLAWLIKLFVLKYGGVKLYRTLRPGFLGLILGHFAAAGMWLVIDFCLGTVGHSLYTY